MLKLKVLDNYIIRKYFSTFFFSLLICTLISVAIDFSDKVKQFIEKTCTLYEIVFDYFSGFILHMAGLLMPLYTLIAVVFFTSRLAFNSEILSILNAGVSFRRLLQPYLIAGSAIALLHFFLNHFIVPEFNKSRLLFERTYVWTTGQDKGKTSNVHFLVAPDTKVFIRGYNKNSKSASGLRLEKFVGSRIVSILEADNASWKGEPNRWQLNSYSIRNFNGLHEDYRKFNTPLDTAINLAPEDFTWYHNQNEEMTTVELLDAIARDRSRGLSNSRQYEIEFHRRTADAFTNIILTIIGLAIAGRKVRGGMGLHLAVGIGIGAGFILLSKFAVSFASSGTVPIMLGMWIPNIIFLGIAIWLAGKAQK
ncbi:MAG: LptF/LptG family permease [Lewinellaceae bacterium]|nr:LptF/LptG family permease [Saprospiraceae bacterium]MCB0543492.1 LptF/LptG family permease [Saprospiraceae bacterium]MCB9305050.1 LptF/LptG family permease [Lewinellaceae bacterium]MCB9353328.1 LptF/LptG family permease [Lewinellaceae bacterium]